MVKGRGKGARLAAASKAAARKAPAPGRASVGSASGGSADAGGFVVDANGLTRAVLSPGVAPSDYDPSKDAFWTEGADALDALRLGKGSKPLGTRAEFEEHLSRYPALGESTQKLLAVAGIEGLDVPASAKVLRGDMPGDYAAYLAGVPDGMPKPDPAEGAPLPTLAHDGGSHSVSLVRAMREHCGHSLHTLCVGAEALSRKFGTDAGVAALEESRRQAGMSDHVALHAMMTVAGWDTGRETTPEKWAKNLSVSPSTVKGRMARAEKKYGVSFEEVRRLAAHKHGKRHLWPDEKDGTYKPKASARKAGGGTVRGKR